MSAKPDTRLSLETAHDMFDKLKWEERRLIQTWGVFDSFNFIITAHHLYVDWLKPNIASAMQVSRKKNLPSSAKMVFRAIRDVSNGSKHWRMTNPKSLEGQVVSSVDKPIVGDWFAYIENKPMAYFEFDKYRLSMAELSAFVMKYFEWIFDDEDKPFPVQLTMDLQALSV